jgi:hypothetical protein
VHQASSVAGEMMRVRREPAVIAMRRVRSAKRRLSLWGIGGAIPAGGVVVELLKGAVAFSSAEILRTVLYIVLLVVCLAGVARAAIDVRRRTAIMRALPPPAPTRTVVSPRIRPLITQLGEYSDSLRQLAGMTGLDPGSVLARELRLDIVASADAAERTLRKHAAEFTNLDQAAGKTPADARAGLLSAADRLAGQIKEGVAEYGAYVTAVSHIVVAGRSLRADSSELTERTEQLRGLAMGMRELAG